MKGLIKFIYLALLGFPVVMLFASERIIALWTISIYLALHLAVSIAAVVYLKGGGNRYVAAAVPPGWIFVIGLQLPVYAVSIYCLRNL